MSACLSSPIAVLATHTAPRPAGVDDAETVDLLAVLAGLSDPRARRGRRHRLATVLAIAVCAVLAGARSYTAIAEWAHDLPATARMRLGIATRGAPSESAIRRLLQAVDAEVLDRTVSGWLGTRASAAGPVPQPGSDQARRLIAIDGKTARGARVRGSGESATGTGPAAMATLRNLAVSIHRLTGATNIAAACRHVSRHPNRVLALLT